MKLTAQDERCMRRALAVARRGVGLTSPNPAVGAVLARRGRIIGEGWHQRAGTAHAEINALRGRDGRGATLYVTLEPCCTQGRTPPCTDAIIAAGVARVVVAATDPNPRHRGRGLRLLRRAGVTVEAGLLAEAATELNAAFNKWITSRRPLVTAKLAMSLDGKIATWTGDSKWITATAARGEAHRLRAQADAVMVGSKTVIRDDPQLTLRHGVRGRQPWRVVVDARGRCPRTARLLTDKLRMRTIVFTTALAPASWQRQLALAGVTVCVVPHRRGRVELAALLAELGRMEVTSVLVEGGGELVGALFDARLVDRVALFYAPVVIGGRAAVTAVQGVGAKTVAAAVKLRNCRWEALPAGNVLVTGEVRR